jgi:hypothetical protein
MTVPFERLVFLAQALKLSLQVFIRHGIYLCCGLAGC